MNSVDGGHVIPDVEVAETAREPLAPGTMVGPHRILTLIASGGMGDVYRARDERLGRDVALKVLPPGITGDRERIERFAQEAKSASALNHPNIVAIYEIGKDRPSPVVQPISAKAQRAEEIHYIAMELVEGQTLREYLGGTSPSLVRKLELLAQMAEGLGKAHGAGIVHRDLKPDNIMVSVEGYAKVVDFGLAKLVEPARGWNPLGADSPTMRAITQQGEVMGTAGYMSPEQIVGKTVDQRSDIFSFGCIVYEAVTGRRPFDGESFVDTMHQVLHATPAPVEEHPELQRVVSKCLVKDREYRYQSIRDVALDLRSLARELEAPISGPHVVAAAPAAVTPSRRLWWIAAAAAAFVALTIAAWRFVPRSAAAPDAPLARATMQRITSTGHVSHVAASGDGRFVAYSASDEKGQSVWLAQTATNSAINVVPPSPAVFYSGLAFSADSNHLLTASYEGSVYGKLQMVPVLGGAMTKIVTDTDTPASASPDGKQIAFTRDVLDRERESRVIVASKDGTNERVVATFPLPSRALSPVWSPDGKRIATAHGGTLYLIDVAKSTKASVATPGWRGSVRDVSWNGDDTLLVSGSDDRTAGHLQLFSVSLRRGDVHPITSDSDDYFEPHVAGDSIAAIQSKRQATLWSAGVNAPTVELTRGLASSDGLGGAVWTRDNRIVYTSSAAGPVDLWMANADGSSPRQLTHDDTIESNPIVTADGTSIVYLTRSKSDWGVWRMNIDGSQPHRLASAAAIYGIAVAPDSKRVVYASCDDDKKQCALLATTLDGAAPTTIATTGVFLQYLRITPDSTRIVFTALGEKEVRLFTVPMSGGKPQPLLPSRATDASISPDGKRVASEFDMGEKGAKLAIFDIAGGTPQLFELDGESYRWLPDNRGIVFIKATGDAWNVFLFRDGATKQLTNFTDGSIANLDIAPDGKILLTHFVEMRDVVLLSR